MTADEKGLIDFSEIENLSARYGPPQRRHYALKVGERMATHWREKLAKRRGEVVLVIRRPNGRILLHSKGFYPAGTYRLLSGGIEESESVLDALRREVQEETGLTVKIERFLGLLEYEFHYQGETMPFVSYVFFLRERGGVLAPGDESEAITAFREASVDEIGAVARALRSLPGDWEDWGQFRALAHAFVAEAACSKPCAGG